MPKAPETPEIRALLSEVARLTTEIETAKNHASQVATERRELFVRLKESGVTYPRLAEVTGLHKMTIQQDVAGWRKVNSPAGHARTPR